MPPINECDVIVTFLENPISSKPIDDGSLDFLFKNYIDDGIREPIINFGKAVGNEQMNIEKNITMRELG
jgi:hypothetical protein